MLGSRSSAKNPVQNSAQLPRITLTSSSPPWVRPHAKHGPANLLGDIVTSGCNHRTSPWLYFVSEIAAMMIFANHGMS